MAFRGLNTDNHRTSNNKNTNILYNIIPIDNTTINNCIYVTFVR